MEKINSTIKVYAQIITFLIIWALVVLITNSYSTNNFLPLFKRVPQAISIYAIVGVIFVKWTWRWKIFQGWLIKVPDLEGTWKGELKSDWIDPKTQKGIDPIPMILVIKQTFSSIQVTLMTKESTSYSTTADFGYPHGGEETHLAYNYTNRPKVTIRDRSAIHDGAAILRVVKKPSLMLEGEYWTSRKTRGEISLKFQSKKPVDKFFE
jgi:hypothetical protein